jgi:hypothetical protein
MYFEDAPTTTVTLWITIPLILSMWFVNHSKSFTALMSTSVSFQDLFAKYSLKRACARDGELGEIAQAGRDGDVGRGIGFQILRGLGRDEVS